MSKKYGGGRPETSAVAAPEQVGVATEEIAADMREGLLRLADLGPQLPSATAPALAA